MLRINIKGGGLEARAQNGSLNAVWGLLDCTDFEIKIGRRRGDGRPDVNSKLQLKYSTYMMTHEVAFIIDIQHYSMYFIYIQAKVFHNAVISCVQSLYN